MDDGSKPDRLVQIDVGGVQSYIFDGSRLREWRGASALLDRAERVALPETIRDLEGSVTVLREGGGVMVLGVGADVATDDVVQALIDEYQHEAPGARVYGASVSFRESVQDTLSVLTFRVERNRGKKLRVDSKSMLLGAMARPCDSCGRRPAEEGTEISDDGRLVCGVCSHKGRHGGNVRRGEAEASVLDRFRDHLQDSEEQAEVDPDDLTDCLPDDLNAVAEAGHGSIALIQADGNSLGKTVQQIASLDQYAALAEGVDGAVETALFNTLAQHGPANGTLPWEILFLGGDDILIATADTIALEVALSLTNRIEKRTDDLFATDSLRDLGRSHLSMGVGIGVADPHVPISVLRSLAHELERSAKKRTYRLQNEDPDTEVSTFDLHRIAGSGSASLSHIRDHVLRPRRARGFENVSLTQRPFTLEELTDVLEVARQWKKEGLPTNKLHALRESLFVSPAEAMRQWSHTVGRASKTNRSAWLELQQLQGLSKDATQAPFVMKKSGGDASPHTATTPLLDVLDIHALL